MKQIAFRSAFSLALFASAFAIAGCERDTTRPDVTTTRPGVETTRDGKVGTTPMTDKSTMSNEAAIQAIANARCGRETRCNNVGSSKRWASAEACRTDLMAKGRDELRAAECPGGIVQKELQECLTEISNEDCNNPLDTLGRLAACRSSDLCKASGI
ncbi:MAG TPA: DUF6184 family natural product biosynthesis lipoprotein [Polyangiaceae bacterium]|nr:DUF6184 family natural product biosynthesis lipoprotein [Polyangiaceae bacterium]